MANPKGSVSRAKNSSKSKDKKQSRRLLVASLFSGIGGFELGLQRAGHQISLFCEKNPEARRVLAAKFRGVPIRKDIVALKKLPRNVDLVTAGFPCQDLSPVGKTAGVNGQQFKLVWEVFRLI